MQATEIRKKLYQLIDTMDDKIAEAIYTLLTEEDIEIQRKKLIQAERIAFLQGKGKSYSWEEVKDMALNKEKGHDLSNRRSPSCST